MKSEVAAPEPGSELAAKHRKFPDWPLEEMRTKKATADLYRLVYGPKSAQWIMAQMGFPTPPNHAPGNDQMTFEFEVGGVKG